MPVQRIRIAGNDFVLLLEEEYHALSVAASALSSSFRKPVEVSVLEAGAPKSASGESRLRTWRKHRAMSQKDLANRVGIAHSYLTQIENGHRAGKPALWRALAQVLGATVDDILPDE